MVVIGAIMILFPTGEKQRKNNKEAVKEGVKVKNIFPATITEEIKRSLSERPAGIKDATITDEIRRSLTTRPPGVVDAVIIPGLINHYEK